MPLLVSVDLNKYDAPTNLAYNEACLNQVRSGYPIVRIFTFSQPGLILAKHESLWDVRDDHQHLATRRHTGGSVIYVDQNTLGYTVIFRKKDLEKSIRDVYRKLTEPIAQALREEGLNATIGNLFSLRVDGKVIGGHAQYRSTKGIQYDGIVHIEKPDVEKIEKAIRLRTLCLSGSNKVVCIDGNVYDIDGTHLGQENQFALKTLRDERREISEMPGLREFGLSQRDYIDMIKQFFERVFNMQSVDDDLRNFQSSAIELAEKKYRNMDWVSDGKRKGLGHCFVDLVEPENRT